MDSTNFGIGIEVTLFGISLGTFYGNLKDGLGININVIAAKGSINISLDGTAVMLHLVLTPIWGNGIDVTQKLIDLGEDASEV